SRRLVQMRLEQFRYRLTSERRPSGEHLVQHDAEAVDIAARIDPWIAAYLLRRHVARCTDDRARLPRPAAILEDLRETDIDDLEPVAIGVAIVRNQHGIAGLDVAEDRAGLMDAPQPDRELASEAQCLQHRQRTRRQVLPQR